MKFINKRGQKNTLQTTLAHQVIILYKTQQLFLIMIRKYIKTKKIANNKIVL